MEDSEALAVLWRKTDLITPMVLRVAATLRLADHVAAGRTSMAELADVAACDQEGLERIVRYLTLDGVFSMQESGAVALGPVGACLRSDHPSGARDRLDLEGFGGCLDRCAFDLLEAIRSGDPAWERLYGSTMWEDLDKKPAVAKSFHHFMAAQITAVYPHVVEVYPWSDLRYVIDVGGGTGALLAELAMRYPALTGKVVDLPLAVEGARRRFADRGLEARLSAHQGSFFDPLPQGADAYVLSRVIHDWDDERATRILRRCAAAVGNGGRVLIIEAVLGKDNTLAVAALELCMLTFIGGRERNLPDYEALTGAAGLKIAAVIPLAVPGQAIIECRLAD